MDILIISLILSGCGAFLGWLITDLNYQLKAYENRQKAEEEDAKVYDREDN